MHSRLKFGVFYFDAEIAMNTRNQTHTKEHKAITFWIRKKDGSEIHDADLLQRVHSKFPKANEDIVPYEVGLALACIKENGHKYILYWVGR
jgi:hypothetical protein